MSGRGWSFGETNVITHGTTAAVVVFVLWLLIMAGVLLAGRLTLRVLMVWMAPTALYLHFVAVSIWFPEYGALCLLAILGSIPYLWIYGHLRRKQGHVREGRRAERFGWVLFVFVVLCVLEPFCTC